MSAARNDLNVSVTRVFDAPVALVYEAFTRAEHLVHWWRPEGFLRPRVDALDVRPGGKWRIHMPREDGTKCTAYGVYREVVENERLAWDDFCDDNDGNHFHTAYVAVAFEDLGGKTRVTLRMRLDPPANRDPSWTIEFMEKGWKAGWEHNLGHFAQYLARHRRPG